MDPNKTQAATRPWLCQTGTGAACVLMGAKKMVHSAFRFQDSLSCHSLCRFSCESGRHLHGRCAMTYLRLTKSSTLPQVIVASDAWIIGRSCSINKSHISTTWAVLHMKRPGLALYPFKVAPPFLEGAGRGHTPVCATRIYQDSSIWHFAGK